jgi:transcriptional regulator with XRE-family HTH domain
MAGPTTGATPTDEPDIDFGAWLEARMAQRGYRSDSALAREINTTPSAVSRWRTGVNKDVKKHNVAALAEALDVGKAEVLWRLGYLDKAEARSAALPPLAVRLAAALRATAALPEQARAVIDPIERGLMAGIGGLVDAMEKLVHLPDARAVVEQVSALRDRVADEVGEVPQEAQAAFDQVEQGISRLVEGGLLDRITARSVTKRHITDAPSDDTHGSGYGT